MTSAGLVSGVSIWGMKMNASETKSMIISRSHIIHPQSPTLTVGGTVLKESDDFAILGVIFDDKMTFEKLLCLVSRATSQRLGIWRKSWRVCHERWSGQVRNYCGIIPHKIPLQ